MALSWPALALRPALAGHLVRWRGPGIAILTGLALAYKPTLALWSADVPWVLNVYQDIRIGAADLVLALLAACVCLSPGAVRLSPPARATAFAGLALLATLALSVTVAQAPPLACATVARCGIGLLAALALALRPAAARWILLGVVGAFLVQVPIVALQVLTQSTFPTGRLFDGWTRETGAAMSGAAVVIGPGDLRWQRALGTFPHPNVLGGFVAVGLVLALPLLLADRHGTPAATWRRSAIWALGWLILLLTFSRAALLAAALGCGLQLAVGRSWRRPAALRLARLSLVPLVIAGLILAPLVLDRNGVGRSTLASPSVRDRELIAGIAWQMIRQDPWRGVGAGNFTLAELRPPFNAVSVEPAHAVPLLLAAESGVIAGTAWLALLVAPVTIEWRRMRRIALDRVALPAALLTLALLDHYLWTFGPGRALYWLALGTWLAQDGVIPNQRVIRS